MLAVGVAEPYTPPGVGMEHTHHYAEVRPVESYADRRVLLIGKQNSGFELATGLLPWARQIVLASPSKTRLSVDTRTLVGVRARYVQPYEDFVLGGGVSVLDAAIDRIEGAADGAKTVYLRRTDGGADLALEVDDAISATGFVCPLVDLPDLGVGDFGASRLPVQTPVVGERQRPGHLLRRDDRAGREGPPEARRAGRTPGPSTAPATTPGCWPGGSPASVSGSSRSRPHLAPDAIAGFVATELAECARALPPARLPRPRAHRGPSRRDARRWRPAADPRPRRQRAGRARGDPRGRRIRGHLPGRLHADRGQGRRAGHRAAIR